MQKTIKQAVRGLLGTRGQDRMVRLLIRSGWNNRYILFTGRRAEPGRVNLDYCHDFRNIGDNISPVLVRYAAKVHGVDPEQEIAGTKHLYGVGSILTAGAQDCTVWGSGLLNTRILGRLDGRRLDVRAVRGPLTRAVLMDRGFQVPEVYGDPAVLMPLIFDPQVSRRYSVSLVTHMNEETALPDGPVHRIDPRTSDYEQFVRQIKASERVIASSLHGIIFAEAYGIPAVLLRPRSDLFKYFDYYYSTGRMSFPIAETAAQALEQPPPPLPELRPMQQRLLEAFPTDLWD